MSAPKTLYVRRNVLNSDAIIAWARGAGFRTTLPLGGLHVTLAHSKAPVDWDAAVSEEAGQTPITINDGPRAVEPLGDKGSIVLRFDSAPLNDRWAALKAAGAEWDFPGYKPHVTISYDAGDVDLATVEPYDGPIQFGAEIFEEVNPGWFDQVKGRTPVATDSKIVIALDRDSVRTVHKDGRLEVALTNISKATVNPYLGREIPDNQALGLDPDRIYNLLRDPEELRKAAPTFNGVPLLRRHVPVSAEDHKPYDVVGTVGTQAAFDGTYLQNSLHVWAQDAIDEIESGGKKELSCGYHYKAVMTPGEFGGRAYDGVMMDIVGNHVALVKDGRAGPDVLVGDSREELDMAKPTKFARTMLNVTTSLVRPRMAMDAKPLDLGKLFSGVSTKNFAEKKPGIVTALKSVKLAQDASLETVIDMLDTLEKVKDADADSVLSDDDAAAMHQNAIIEPPPARGRDAAMEFFKKKGIAEDDLKNGFALLDDPNDNRDDDDTAKKVAKDEDADEARKASEEEAKRKADEADKLKAEDKNMGKDTVTKQAMDEALKAVADETTKRVREEQRGIRMALDEVRPLVGELPAALGFDSGEQVYRHALTMLGVDGAKTIHASALPAILKMQPKPGQSPRRETADLGMDAAGAESFGKRFAGADRISSV